MGVRAFSLLCLRPMAYRSSDLYFSAFEALRSSFEWIPFLGASSYSAPVLHHDGQLAVQDSSTE